MRMWDIIWLAKRVIWKLMAKILKAIYIHD